MTRYSELNKKFKDARDRIIAGVGQEQFNNAVTARFPLVLTDSALFNIAEELGWQHTWLRAAPRAKAAPPVSGNLQAFMAKAAGAVPAAAGVVPPIPAVAAPMAAPVPWQFLKTVDKVLKTVDKGLKTVDKGLKTVD